MTLASLILKKHEERRLRAGHLWVFSNEVDTGRTPLTGFTPGQPVAVYAHNGKGLGSGYVNPHSLICARLLSPDPARPFSNELLRERIAASLQWRERLFDAPYYRLVYGESDGLPGLIVDRYGTVLVVQLNTAGMEQMKQAIIDALIDAVSPAGILLRNDSSARALEGLPSYVEVGHGDVPQSVAIREHGCRFEVPMHGGQKTGWFFDHRRNRERMLRYVAGKRVLDVFSYLGAWGLQAAVAGAAHVTCVDSSAAAAERLRHNAALNGCEHRLEIMVGDAFDALKALRHDGRAFDVVILDPPAFVKRRKDLEKGAEAYRRLNAHAMQLIADDGVLVTASCSSHVSAADFRDLLRQAALSTDRFVRILEQGHQDADHPVHPAIPETEYLKAFILAL